MASVLDIGVDYGTSSVVVYGKGKGVLLNEPAVVAYERDSHTVLAVGTEARRMVGRTPGNIVTVRPLAKGVMSDYDLASALLRVLVARAVGKRLLKGPRVLISMPAGINDREQHAIATSLFEAGARRTQMMETPIAAAIGARLPIGEAYGKMICDIGGGIADIAVISLGRVVVRETVKYGGDAFDDAIIRYIRRKHNMLIGPLTAEDLKINIGSVLSRNEQFYMEVTGRDLLSGLPRVLNVTSDEISEAMDEPLHSLLEAIHEVLEHTPAELVADVFESGIVLTGGGALLGGLVEAVEQSMKIKCILADNPQECVARGCGKTLEEWGEYSHYLNDKKRR